MEQLVVSYVLKTNKYGVKEWVFAASKPDPGNMLYQISKVRMPFMQVLEKQGSVTLDFWGARELQKEITEHGDFGMFIISDWFVKFCGMLYNQGFRAFSLDLLWDDPDKAVGMPRLLIRYRYPRRPEWNGEMESILMTADQARKSLGRNWKNEYASAKKWVKEEMEAERKENILQFVREHEAHGKRWNDIKNRGDTGTYTMAELLRRGWTEAEFIKGMSRHPKFSDDMVESVLLRGGAKIRKPSLASKKFFAYRNGVIRRVA